MKPGRISNGVQNETDPVPIPSTSSTARSEIRVIGSAGPYIEASRNRMASKPTSSQPP
jgi:hypothetical protein